MGRKGKTKASARRERYKKVLLHTSFPTNVALDILDFRVSKETNLIDGAKGGGSKDERGYIKETARRESY
jgi:hypothetical protein